MPKKKPIVLVLAGLAALLAVGLIASVVSTNQPQRQADEANQELDEGLEKLREAQAD